MTSHARSTCHQVGDVPLRVVEVLGQLVLHVAVLEGLPAELVRLEVDHAAATDGRRRRLLQVGRLEDQVHRVAHLDDLAAHQAQLWGAQQATCGDVIVRQVSNTPGRLNFRYI